MGPLSFYVHTNEFTSLEAFIPSIFKVLMYIKYSNFAPGAGTMRLLQKGRSKP